MDSSSAWELFYSVSNVVDNSSDFMVEASSMSSILVPCQEIRDVFHGVNEELFQAWDTVMGFCDKTTTAISQELRGLYNAIAKFCFDTHTNEGEVKIATTVANDKAEELLNQLGL